MGNFFLALIVFAAIVLVAFVFIRSRRSKYSAMDLKMFADHFRVIAERVGRDPEQALVDADKLLDLALKKRGYEGSLGDKLKAARVLFSDIDGVWKAHKLRNKIAHEVGFRVSSDMARVALISFKGAFHDLGIHLQT